VRFALLMHYGRDRLIEEWQLVILDIYNLKLRVVPAVKEIVHPLCDSRSFSSGRVLPTMIPTLSISFFSLLVRSSGDLWFLRTL